MPLGRAPGAALRRARRMDAAAQRAALAAKHGVAVDVLFVARLRLSAPRRGLPLSHFHPASCFAAPRVRLHVRTTGRSERPVGAQQTLQLADGTDSEVIEVTEFARLVGRQPAVVRGIAHRSNRRAGRGALRDATVARSGHRRSLSMSTGRTTATRRTSTPRGGSAPISAARWRTRRTAARARPSRRRTPPTRRTSAGCSPSASPSRCGGIARPRAARRGAAERRSVSGLRGTAPNERGARRIGRAPRQRRLPRGARGAHEAK